MMSRTVTVVVCLVVVLAASAMGRHDSRFHHDCETGTISQKSIKVGDHLPHVANLPSHYEGMHEDISLDDICEDTRLVLVGMHGAFHPESFDQIKAIMQNGKELDKLGAEKFGVITTDTIDTLEAFFHQERLSEWLHSRLNLFPVSDANLVVSKALGFLQDHSHEQASFKIREFSMIVDDCIVARLNVNVEPAVAHVQLLKDQLAEMAPREESRM